MSALLPDSSPVCHDVASDVIALCIEGKPRDLGGLTVRRALPSMRRRLVGPFVFFDHMGPVTFADGFGIDVRPHPHIELATVTYLFEGEIDHRDSLGSFQTIRPGDVNWMVAGRGIVHSERTGLDARRAGTSVHGIQSWVALPLEHERTLPRFEHHDAEAIPIVRDGGATLGIVAGTAYGKTSPVGVLSPTLYVHALLAAGTTLRVDDAHEERAAYVVDGEIACDGRPFRAGMLLVLEPGARVDLVAARPARVMLLGGAKLEGERHVYWNFVSSSKERIEQAKADWRAGRFPKVPGDDVDFIPLPEDRPAG